ncbi:TetR/AcrR family transcriptional regulator [Amorphus orientalis]|uniref:AcrR family transcriptional regulator n=1 Tax=Amorphus orientalis TaxID=649198 RepID=A0AAE4ATM1_9HYPH|nr:TetR/AcrR family transcriptional regulator [Amorphus orientalis]MDQ0316453.1 AcrR family transcriptional regulator [Amorphus orientalis]
MARAAAKTSDAAAGSGARLGATDWIDVGLKLLAGGNVEDVRVEVIARQLKVTKGSFYWHFKNRRELLARILEHWTDWATVQVSRWALSEGETPRERLEWLLTLPARSRPDRRGADIELAIRSWARHDALAAATVEKVDLMRADFFVALLSETALPDAVIRERAATAQAFMLGEALLKTGLDRDTRLANARAVAALLTREDPDPCG